MSKSVKLQCDGCRIKLDNPEESGWFVLSQLPPDEKGDDLKLEGELHFHSLDCLAKWVSKAKAAIPGLQQQARELSPRGHIFDESVKGLYV